MMEPEGFETSLSGSPLNWDFSGGRASTGKWTLSRMTIESCPPPPLPAPADRRRWGRPSSRRRKTSLSLLCPARHHRARDTPVDVGEAVGLGQVCHVESLARTLQEVGRAEERGHSASSEAR
jgi:hypothetical protein